MRHKSHRLAGLLLVFGIAIAPGAALGGVVEDGRQLVQGMADQVVSILKNQGLSRSQREDRFARIFQRHFDVETIGPWVMGRAWRSANAQQKARLKRLFEDYIIKTYTIQLSKYSGEEVRVVDAEQDGAGAVVTSHIVGSGRPVVLKWRLRRTGGQLKVRDVVIDNISMSLNQRREFAAVYRREGNQVSGLIDAMERKVQQLNNR